ncbi:hypothetical protein AB0L06_43375 [Spirillospora sp. NPDC052269]
MNLNTNTTAQDWDKDINYRELQGRLTGMLRLAGQSPPILDDDDLEAAIEEAADGLTPN